MEDILDEIYSGFDSNGNCIHLIRSVRYEEWNEYDENNNLIHTKNSNGYECYIERDDLGNPLVYKEINKSPLIGTFMRNTYIDPAVALSKDDKYYKYLSEDINKQSLLKRIKNKLVNVYKSYPVIIYLAVYGIVVTIFTFIYFFRLIVYGGN